MRPNCIVWFSLYLLSDICEFFSATFLGLVWYFLFVYVSEAYWSLYFLLVSLSYSMFILAMCILLQYISNTFDFVKYIRGKMGLWRKELIAIKLLLRGKILSLAYVCLLEQRARNTHGQNEQTSFPSCCATWVLSSHLLLFLFTRFSVSIILLVSLSHHLIARSCTLIKIHCCSESIISVTFCLFIYFIDYLLIV